MRFFYRLKLNDSITKCGRVIDDITLKDILWSGRFADTKFNSELKCIEFNKYGKIGYLWKSGAYWILRYYCRHDVFLLDSINEIKYL